MINFSDIQTVGRDPKWGFLPVLTFDFSIEVLIGIICTKDGRPTSIIDNDIMQ